jgi:hypothetical protein
MRAVSILLFSGLSLASIAACAPISGEAETKAALAASCPVMEGYPDCHSGEDSAEIVRIAPAHSS